ncbi:hypothetical protein GCM10023237_66870 [Streptomyces coeruleoprunus]
MAAGGDGGPAPEVPGGLLGRDVGVLDGRALHPTGVRASPGTWSGLSGAVRSGKSAAELVVPDARRPNQSTPVRLSEVPPMAWALVSVIRNGSRPEVRTRFAAIDAIRGCGSPWTPRTATTALW